MVRPTLSVVPEQGDSAAHLLLRQPTADRAHSRPAQQTVPAEADWTVRAVCTTTDPDSLFVTGAAQRDAAKICQACPVRLECLADALDNHIEYGVWGGMTERQRRAVLKKSPEVTSWRALLEEARVANTQEAAS